jgi:hypothetical protein
MKLARRGKAKLENAQSRIAVAASIRVVARMGAVRETTVTLLGGPAELWVHYRPGSGPVA